jgi:penicillin-insensitive murein endopeptidase
LSNRRLRLALGAALLAAALPCAATSGRPPDPPAARDSVSVGTPMSGSLVRGEVLPTRGSGFRMMRTTRDRKARFGVSELVRLVEESAHAVRRRIPGSLLMVGDLSPRKGGRVEHHGSHQSGRDVDFAFYMINNAGQPEATEVFVPFDANGHSVEPPMEYRFDTARNWALVRALLESKTADVQWIFVADHLRALLLDHGETSGAPRSVLGRARQVLHQPGRKGHWDHFHVRIYCPAGDLPRCRDVGPRRAWTR